MALCRITTAERLRGCVWAENFRSAADIARNGGTITGALQFDMERGAYFDGVNDYVTYPATAQPFASSGFWSAVLEFWPQYESDDGNQYFFFEWDNAGAHRFLVYKTAVGDGNTIDVYCDSTPVLQVLNANYKPYWKTSQRNVLCIAAKSAGTAAYLNGVLVGTGAGAYSAYGSSDRVTVGAAYTTTVRNKAWYRSLKFFRHGSASELLTAQEAKDYYNNATFNYESKAAVILPMRMQDHDAVGVRTLDRSGKGRHFQFGDGITPAKYPTKLATRGYSFNGTSQYMNYLTPVGFTGDVSISYVLRRNSNVGNQRAFVLKNVPPGGGFELQTYMLNGSNNVFFGYNDGCTGIDTGVIHVPGSVLHYTWVFTLATHVMQLFINANLKYTSGPAATPYGYNNGIEVGHGPGDALYLNADLYGLGFWPIALTPLQVADLYCRVMRGLDKV